MIDRFAGPYGFLSNFAPARVVLEGEPYPTVEHAYQAAKVEFDDCALYGNPPINLKRWRHVIQEAASAAAAKRIGRRVPLRPDWDEIKVRVMAELLGQKFAPGTAYREKLQATGDATLIEGNTWGDTYWGVCNGKGTNMLGQILMAIRDAR